MSADNMLGLIIAAAISVYLVVTLLFPERM